MAESAKPLDTTAAEAYEKFLVPTLNRPLAEDAIELAAAALNSSCRRKPASSKALIRMQRVFWTPAFSGVTSRFSTNC
jgi:hypothetical protein